MAANPDATIGTRGSANEPTRPTDATTATTGTPVSRRPASSDAVLTVLVGAVCALGTVVVSLAYRWPPVPSDQLNYLDAARDFPLGPWAEPLHQHLRIGLTWPMRAAMMAFDYSETTYYLVPIVATVGLALATYALGVLLFGRAVGVGAAVLTVGNSLVFDDIAAPLPDLPATALFCLALALAVGVRQRRSLLVRRGREPAVLVLIGVLLAWSYLTREYIVFVWPLIPLVLAPWSGAFSTQAARATLRRLLPRLLWVAAPMALIWLGETVLNAVVYDDPLARLHAASGHDDVLGEQAYAAAYQGHERWWYFIRFWVILVQAPEGFWLGAAAILTVLGGLLPARRLRFLLGWALLLFVPLTLLGGVWDPDDPMLRLIKQRYWYPIMPAISLAAVAMVWLTVRAVVRRVAAAIISVDAGSDGSTECEGAATPQNARPRAGVRLASAVAAAVLALAMAGVPVWLAHAQRCQLAMYHANGANQMQQLRTWLNAHGDNVDVLRADPRTTRIVQIFANTPFGSNVWAGEVVGWYPQLPPETGDYALVYSPRTRLCELCRSEAQSLLGSPPHAPTSWRLAFASTDRELRLYEVR